VSVEYALFTVGLVIVAFVVQTAVRTVVLPRAARVSLSAVVFGAVALTLRWIASHKKTYKAQDDALAIIAPVGMLLIPASWFALLLVGFANMFWATDPDIGAGGAFNLAGSSLTTLGFAPALGAGQRLLAFTAAILGLLVLTLFITYLPSVYSAFQARERKVALLEVRAGSPPSASEMLIRFHRIGWLDQLSTEWLSWEPWFAELEETHTTYAALPWFRSTDPNHSWVTAAGTVLDAASLWISSCAGSADADRAAAQLMIRAGYVSLRRIAQGVGIESDPSPSADDPIAIQRSEFDAAFDALQEAGMHMHAEKEQAWRDFSGWRVNYETDLLGLAEVLRVPYAPWTSDRSALVRGRIDHRSATP